MRRAWYGLNQAFRRRIAHLGITPDQFTALRTLIEHRELTQTQLTRLMASDPNTIASLLERMESNGLIDRKRLDSDRRTRLVSVRPAGQRKYEEARDIAVHLQSEVLGPIPSSQRERFLSQLASVADACRAAVDDSKRAGPASARRRA